MSCWNEILCNLEHIDRISNYKDWSIILTARESVDKKKNFISEDRKEWFASKIRAISRWKYRKWEFSDLNARAGFDCAHSFSRGRISNIRYSLDNLANLYEYFYAHACTTSIVSSQLHDPAQPPLSTSTRIMKHDDLQRVAAFGNNTAAAAAMVQGKRDSKFCFRCRTL